MTAIGGSDMAKLLQTDIDKLPLKIGAKLTVEVLGPTRHSLAVCVGSNKFFLNADPSMATAKSLTLQVMGRTNQAEFKVRILAQDRQPLANPPTGETSLKLQSPIAESVSRSPGSERQTEVRVQPLDRQGREVGPPFTVRLSTTSSPMQVQASIDKPKSEPPALPVRIEKSSGAYDVGKPVQEHRTPASDPIPRAVFDHGRAGPSKALSSVAEMPSLPSDRLTIPASVQGLVGRSSVTDAALRAMPSVAGLESQNQQQETKMATVFGRLPTSGQVLLALGDELLLRVEQPIDLPVGTMLQVTFVANVSGLPGAGLPDGRKDPDGPLTKLVALFEAIDRSGELVDGRGDHDIGRQLPMPDRLLATRLLQFLGFQMSEGGKKSSALESNRGFADMPRSQQALNLLLELGQSISEPLTEGWRGAILPLGSDPAQALTIFHREHDPEPDSDEASEDAHGAAAQRAIFDFSLSQLGRCQIDAFCQQQRFDLVIRSASSLEMKDQEVITELYRSTCEIAGLKGEIGYRHGQFVEPAKALRSATTITT